MITEIPSSTLGELIGCEHTGTLVQQLSSVYINNSRVHVSDFTCHSSYPQRSNWGTKLHWVWLYTSQSAYGVRLGRTSLGGTLNLIIDSGQIKSDGRGFVGSLGYLTSDGRCGCGGLNRGLDRTAADGPWGMLSRTGFYDWTKVQIGQGQHRIDITNDCQEKALKEGCHERKQAQMDVSSIEKTNTK